MKIKKCEEQLWIKINDLIRSVTKQSDDYDEKYIKIKFYLDDELPLYPHIFLNECLYEIYII